MMKRLSAFVFAFVLFAGMAFAVPSAEGNGDKSKQGQSTQTEESNQYQADFDAIESLFENAESETAEIPFAQMEESMDMAPNGTNDSGSLAAAIILCFFLGGLGIHRLILGGRGILILYYIITCGGIFGIVPFVDFILLIVDAVNGGGSRFENNDKFIAW